METQTTTRSTTDRIAIARASSLLVLGIGNVLMGDEGVGVAVVRELEQRSLPDGVTCLDGGTGGFHLLGPLQEADRVIMIDACDDGTAVGSVRRLTPRFSADYPRRLTAHDIGLKDLLDSIELLGAGPSVTLFAISIRFPQEMGVGLSAELQDRLAGVVESVVREIEPGR